MARIRKLFVTNLYEASLAAARDFEAFNNDLAAVCRTLAAEDKAGRAWSRANGFGGYTSYGSLNDLVRRASVFAELKRRLGRHVGAFVRTLAFDLGGGSLKLDSLWVNVLRGQSAHSGHIHPLSVVSGTYYVTVPARAGVLRLEDPRLPLAMAAPPTAADAPEEQRRFVSVTPVEGDLLMWESWLRHEVLAGRARSPRISISFNYAWR
jgi:uncharacterized protein (TIGR02466 family)